MKGVKSLLGRKAAFPDRSVCHFGSHVEELAGMTESQFTLVFGDSVMRRCADEDRDRRSVPDLLAEALSSPVLSFDGKAFHGTLFAAISRRLCTTDLFRPSRVILGVNPRSLAPQWAAHPGYQFSEYCSQLDRGHVPATITPKSPDSIASADWAEYERVPVSLPWGPGDIGTYRLVNNSKPATDHQWRVRRSVQLWVHYCQEEHLSRTRIDGLAETARIWSRVGVPTHYYVTPVNEDLGTAVGVDLGASMEAAEQRLDEAMGSAGGLHLNKASVRQEQFLHAEEVTEHLNEVGRRVLADSLASGLGASSHRLGS